MTQQKLLPIIILFLSTLTIYSQTNTNSVSYSWTILPSDTVWTEITSCKGCKTWTPSKSDIIEAERILNTCFIKEKEEGHFKTERFLENYTRQYLGSIDKLGHKIIWINSFCSKLDPKDNK